jgi:hypothetical protein
VIWKTKDMIRMIVVKVIGEDDKELKDKKLENRV